MRGSKVVHVSFIFFFLPAIASNNVEDVREVLEYYQQFDDPMLAFRENQRKVQVRLYEFVIISKKKEKFKGKIMRAKSYFFYFRNKRNRSRRS